MRGMQTIEEVFFMTDEEEIKRIRGILKETKGMDVKERFRACVVDAGYKFKGKVMPEMMLTCFSPALDTTIFKKYCTNLKIKKQYGF